MSAPTAPSTSSVSPTERPTPFLQQAMLDTFGRTGAKLGLAWIFTMVVVGSLAPFLASSHPYYVKTAAGWEYPLFRQLGATDYALAGGLAMFFIAWAIVRRLAIAGGIGMITAGVLLAVLWTLVHPPAVQDYGRYRQQVASGAATGALMSPIPFSPLDTSYDLGAVSLQPPSKSHWLGTDRDGQDVASRLIHATRLALTIGFVSTGIQIVVGVIIGGLMGYFAGAVDILGMRLIEIFDAMPRLLVLITVCNFLPRNEATIFLIMAVIGLTSWAGTARYVRAEFLRLRNQDFIQAAQALGLPLRRVLVFHMLPNGLAPVLVSLSFGVASAILLESVLSFLGLGIVGMPSWGSTLEQARSSGGGFYYWLAVFPTIAIFLTVFAYNLIGESLRDALDPKLRQ